MYLTKTRQIKRRSSQINLHSSFINEDGKSFALSEFLKKNMDTSMHLTKTRHDNPWTGHCPCLSTPMNLNTCYIFSEVHEYHLLTPFTLFAVEILQNIQFKQVYYKTNFKFTLLWVP